VVKIIATSSSKPLYDLKLVTAAVAADNVIFGGNSTRDRDDLGYTAEECMTCLKNLTQNHFCESTPYEADVYKMSHKHDECTDLLYIKLRLTNSGCLILSFHLDR
jgi:Motility quorum-sensing regulator, toxin of MqsA